MDSTDLLRLRNCALPWYKNSEESPSSLDQENTVFDALVEALAAAAAAAAKAALQALAEMFR